KRTVDLGIWRRLTQLMIALLVLASFMAVFFWYLPLFQKNARMRKHILQLEDQIQVEARKKAELEMTIWNLRDDPKTVERMAREKLGYAKPGETVIFFEPPRQSFSPQ